MTRAGCEALHLGLVSALCDGTVYSYSVDVVTFRYSRANAQRGGNESLATDNKIKSRGMTKC